MTINRRTVLAGMAAATASAAVPSFPAAARYYVAEGPLAYNPSSSLAYRIRSPLAFPVYQELRFGDWHCHARGYSLWAVRHTATGLTFLSVPQPEDWAAMRFVRDPADREPYKFARHYCLAHAAKSAALQAAFAQDNHRCVPYRQQGAIFLRIIEATPAEGYYITSHTPAPPLWASLDGEPLLYPA